ncbi:MAG: hypothetical protein ACNYPI_00945 [Arenicellales bacterium WSBS_2016_MAG_OTU3]
MNRAEPPGEDEQYEVYTHIVETLNNRNHSHPGYWCR